MSKPLPPERESITHKFRVDKVKVYLTVGLYPDGTPGELFIRAAKTGTLSRSLFSTLSLVISIALQNGVSLSKIIDKLENIRFEPAGLTTNPEIPMASSVPDYVARWLKLRFPEQVKQEQVKQDLIPCIYDHDTLALNSVLQNCPGCGKLLRILPKQSA